MRQVILALLSNAVKLTKEGSIGLRVTHDERRVTISVSDTGVGISLAERVRIFSDMPSDDETDEGGRAPGFGLAISKRVIEKLGGRIWVESREGNGSTITFTLPIKPVGLESR
jgi:signal transduction histidine kinase